MPKGKTQNQHRRFTLLGLSWADNMKPKLVKLQQRLKLSDDQLRKVVVGRPTLLGLSWADNMKPKLRLLGREFGEVALKEAVLQCPALLGYSQAKRFEPRIKRARAAGVHFTPRLLVAMGGSTPENFEKRIALAEGRHVAAEQG
eukprot:COSAG01_NODE_6267_length_3763_cov_10.815502_2_plen_144_part_00